MHRSLLCLFVASLLAGLSPRVQATLVAGDIAFVGFSSDSNDEFAIVSLADLVDETIYFTTNAVGSSGEGILRWQSGGSLIPAGTVVTFVGKPTSTQFGSSLGDLAQVSGVFNMGTSGDGLLAYGAELYATPETYFGGLESASGAAGSIVDVGLEFGLTFMDASGASASVRGGEYIGPRTGETQSGYLAEIYDPGNWSFITSGSSTVILPFDTTSFEVAAVPEARPVLLGALLCTLVGLGWVATRNTLGNRSSASKAP